MIYFLSIARIFPSRRTIAERVPAGGPAGHGQNAVGAGGGGGGGRPLLPRLRLRVRRGPGGPGRQAGQRPLQGALPTYYQYISDPDPHFLPYPDPDLHKIAEPGGKITKLYFSIFFTFSSFLAIF